MAKATKAPPAPSQSRQRPYPGDELAIRVQGGASEEHFFLSGQRSVADLTRALAAAGRSWGDFKRVLDFGCGCGRIATWLDDVVEGELHGVDIDARAVAWCRENLPFGSFEVNQPLPPLPFDDGHFDLVFNHSVFTHLDASYQDAWLAELRRVSAPGATLVLSVHGEHAFAEFEAAYARGGGDPAPHRRTMEEEGIVFIEDDSWTGGPFPSFYHTTFHAPWYVFAHWGAHFEVRAFLPRGDLDFQDIVVLEHTESPLKPVGRPARQAPQGPGGPSPRPAAAVLAALKARARSMLAGPAAGPAAPDPEVQKAISEAWSKIHVMHDALQRHGERVNRLEADLLEMIAALKQRLGDAPAGEPGGGPPGASDPQG